MAPRDMPVTGCSKGGISCEVAFAFQRAGLKVFATARATSKIDEKLSALPNVEVVQLDVVSSASIAAVVEVVEKSCQGKLDILFNNSGQGMQAAFLDADLDQARALFDINYFGTWAVTQAFLPLLLKSKGTIANNASITTFLPLPFQGFYSSSKAAVTSLSHAMRLELAPLGVKVIILHTGTVKTELFNHIAMTDTKMPPNSRYQPAHKEYAELAAGSMVIKSGQQASVYAEKVVSDILNGSPHDIWRGNIFYLTEVLRTNIAYCPIGFAPG